MIKQLKRVFITSTNQNFNTIAAKVPIAMLKPQKAINIQTCLNTLENATILPRIIDIPL